MDIDEPSKILPMKQNIRIILYLQTFLCFITSCCESFIILIPSCKQRIFPAFFGDSNHKNIDSPPFSITFYNHHESFFQLYLSFSSHVESIHPFTKDNNTRNVIKEEKHLPGHVRSEIKAIRKIPLSLSKDDVMRLPSEQRYRYRIKQLLDYNETFGTLDVPYNYQNDTQLAKWVQSQRYEYRLLRSNKEGVKSYLTPQRVELLDAIGFPWNDIGMTEQQGLSNRWMSYWQLLHDYKQENGHVRIPEKCVYRDVKLGIWVKNQRRKAKSQPDDCRTKIRIQKLNELGFIWDTQEMGDTIYNATWMSRYEELKRFYEENGHFCIPRENIELMQWVRMQGTLQQQWKTCCNVNGNVGNTSAMPRQYLMERIQLLKAINFDWDAKRSRERRRNDLWWERFEELRLFYEYYGHTNIANVVRSGKNNTDWNTLPRSLARIHLKRLHRWTKTQRLRYKQLQRYGQIKVKSINHDKIKALTELGFVWDHREELWQSKFQQLIEFGKTYNHFNIPTIHSASAFEGILDPEKHDSDDMREEFMHNITNLGKWAQAQRNKFRRFKRGDALSSRTEKHMRQLDEISFPNDSQSSHDSITSPEEKNLQWDKYFLALQEFQRQNGHCFVPFLEDNGENNQQQRLLYDWVTVQRRKFRTVLKRLENDQSVSEIDLHRLERLKKIGFIFNVHDFRFESGLGRLEKFYAKFGHTKVCPSYTVDPHLYTFVRRQRHLYRERAKGIANSLCDERMKKLSRLDFLWNPRGVPRK
jgi:hypothetical protein